MDWKSIGSTVGAAAPLLGGLLGGPAGAAVGTIVSGLLGCNNSPEAVSAALAADPQALLTLKKYEMDHATELRQIDLDETKAYLGDRSSARTREVEVVKATGKSDLNLYILAWIIVLGFFILCGTLIFVAIPESSNSVVFMLFGILGSGFTGVIGYFFGSSKSSSDKTEMMNQRF